MLENMFLETMHRSMVTGVIVVAVLLLRVLLKRAPKLCSYLLWGLVLYRLLCPFVFTSSISLLGAFVEEDAAQIQMMEADVSTAVQADGEPLAVGDLQEGERTPSTERWERLSGISRLWVVSRIWAAGIAAMFLYGAVSLVLLSRRLKGAVRLRENIYQSDYVPTPFVIGLIHPRIYLPSSLQDKEMDYIILHERTHIRRGDHIIRILSFFALAVYWFHPLVWAAYYLSGKDMEMSCDEAVMRKMGQDIRADYSTSLLNLATGRLFPGGTPLAFGEGDTKTRIKNVMHWRRPKPVVTGIALATVAVAAVVLGTDPKTVDAGNGGLGQTAVENRELQQAADEWAKAVCDRDGNAIVDLSTQQMREELIDGELLSGEAGNYSFGWSSPWPWDSEKDYYIVECAENQTVIQYYAWTSDPHVTVWREALTWVKEDGQYRVKGSSANWVYDNISGSGSFAEAYGAGINGTPIDYLTNGTGEALNENALENREYYQDLFAPETAARSLLNLSSAEKDLTLTAGSRQDDGSVEVTVFFAADGGSAVVKMVQPFGEDGIWVPQDAGYLLFQF